MDFAEVEELLEEGEDFLEKGQAVFPEREIVGKDFDSVKEVGEMGLKFSDEGVGFGVVAAGEN